KGTDCHERIVTNLVATRHQRRAIGDVAVAVLKLIRRQTDAEGESFLHYRHVSLQTRLEHEEGRSGHRRFVSQPATHPDDQVQWTPIHRYCSRDDQSPLREHPRTTR